MKKFTYFMLAAASWMLAMPASAFDVETTPTQASALTDGYYVLKTHGKALTGYLHHDTNYTGNRPFTQTTDFDPASSTDLNYVFHLVKDASTGTFTLQCVGTMGYMPHDSQRGQNFNTSPTEANAANYQYEAIPDGAVGEILDGGVLLYDTKFTASTAGQYYVHFNKANNREANCSYWDGGGMTAADHTVVEFAFYKVNDNIVDVTYNLPDGTTSKGFAMNGSEATVPSTTLPATVSYYYTPTITNEDKVVSETNKTFNVAYTKGDNVPFTFSTEGNETWYTMNVRQAGYYLVVADASSTDVQSRTNATVDHILNGNADWKFVESGYGVKLANKLTGKYIQTPSSNNKASFVSQDEATEFVVIQNGSGFSLKLPGTSSCMGDHCGAYLGTWANSQSTTDAGSRFTVAGSLDAVKTSIDTQVAAAQAAADETLLGHYNTEDVNVIALAKENATSLDDYIAINDKLKALVPGSATPDADAYYQIINVNAKNGYVTTEPITVNTEGVATEAQNIKRVTEDGGSLVPMLWQFEADGDGYKIVNANTGRAFSAVSAVATAIQDVDKSEAGVITLQQLSTKVQFMLKSGDHRINAIYGTTSGAGELADYSGNHDNDAGNYWKIKKITTIPVTISAANYATVGFPFAVTIPEGVKAFIGTSTDNAQLELTEIEGGVIPANTGAIIYHDGATTANFDITTSTESLTDNVLSATTAKRSGFDADATYVLALDGEGKAAFLQSELTTVPANMAFLLSSKVSTSNAGALAFNFGGNTTGINNAVANDAEGTQYFDLQGRHVLYPSNGIFVTNKGKKVFIK